MNDEHTRRARSAASSWKKHTPTLPEAARKPAPWINHEGVSSGYYPFCLPPEFAHHNLLPTVLPGALRLFGELRIPWHCGLRGGPGNHLLSSQVQCVNALFAMVSDPLLIKRAFGNVVDIAEVLEIEHRRFLTFEYIGPTDFFVEGINGRRRRGAGCTSIDAAFLYRTSTGTVELALVEWKYTESYLEPREPDPQKDRTRATRYRADYEADDGPLHPNPLPFDVMLDEPFYQLMRQQLLAHRLEMAGAHDAEVVRVLHVLAPENNAYQASLVRPEHRAVGDTVDDVWRTLLRRPDRFIHVDPAVFLDPTITSAEYVNRYCTGPASASLPQQTETSA